MVLRRLTALMIALLLLLCGCSSAPDPMLGEWEGSSKFGGHLYPANANISESGGVLLMELFFMGRDDTYSFILNSAGGAFTDTENSLSGTYNKNEDGEEVICFSYMDSSGSVIDFELYREGSGHLLPEPVINTVSEEDAFGSYLGSISLFGCVPEDELSRQEIISRFGEEIESASFAYSGSNLTLNALSGSYDIPVTFSDGYISGQLICDDLLIMIEGGFYVGIDLKSAFAGMITADIEGITAIYELRCSLDS